jgi:uncharacterized protein (TIGR02266 family)
VSDSLFRNAERRRDLRISARLEVKFTDVKQAATALNAYSVNFSAGGLCLRTKRPHAVGDQLGLSIGIEGEHFELQGLVAWVKADVIGVRFLDLSPADRQRLEAVSKILAKSHPAAP